MVFIQTGQPRYLRGIWGYGSIVDDDGSLGIRSDRMLAAPLLVPTRTLRKLADRHLSRVLLRKPRESIRNGLTGMMVSDAEALVSIIDSRHAMPVRRPPIEGKDYTAEGASGQDAFETWATRQHYSPVHRGAPDILALAPNGRPFFFEAKDGADKPSSWQRDVMNRFESQGRFVTILDGISNAEAASEIERSGLSIVSQGAAVTNGWPDYFLSCAGRLVLAEVKSSRSGSEGVAHHDNPSQAQIQLLSSLGGMGLEVHVVRAVQDAHARRLWHLYDDTERWLSYPP